jgi:hypothetical protein
MPRPQIIVQCHRKDLDTHYVRITVHEQFITIVHGNIADGFFKFYVEHADSITFGMHPAARDVHDGKAWNLAEVQNQIANSPVKPPRPAQATVPPVRTARSDVVAQQLRMM